MAAPANDNLENAQLLKGVSGSVTGTTVDATNDTPYDYLNDNEVTSSSVWYKLKLPDNWTSDAKMTVRFESESCIMDVFSMLPGFPFPPTSTSDVNTWNVAVFSDTSTFLIDPPADDGYIYFAVGDFGTPGEFFISWFFATSEAAGVSVSFNNETLAPEPLWVGLDDLVPAWQIARGRSSELDKTGTGTAIFATFDTVGKLDPTNPTSPFRDKLDPMKQAKIAIVNPWKLLNEADGTLHNLFRGYVDTWGDFEVDQSGSWITGSVQLVDALDLFAELRMMVGVHGDTPPDGQADIYFAGGPNGYSAGTFVHVDDRMVKVLDDIGWPGTGLARDGALRDVYSGNVAMLEQIYARADQALTVLDDAADAEIPGVANRFMDKDGAFNFRGRFARFFPETPGYGISHWYLGGTPQAVADPENVVVISRLPGFRRSAQDLINACLALPSGADDTDVPGNLVTSPASIVAYGYRSRDIQNLLTYQGHDDVGGTTTAIEETYKFADYRVGNYGLPKTRVNQIEIVALDPRHPLAKAQWAFLCGVELSDLITLTTTHPGGGGFDEDFFVEGIRYSCEPVPAPKLYNLTCTLDVSPRSLYDYNPFGTVDSGLT